MEGYIVLQFDSYEGAEEIVKEVEKQGCIPNVASEPGCSVVGIYTDIYAIEEIHKLNREK